MLDITLRATRRDDAAAVVEVINAYGRAMLGGAEETVDSLLVDWSTPGLCLETDSVVAVLPDGRLAGTAEMWDIQDTHLRMFGYWRIHPDFRGQGLEERLAEWVEMRARRGVPLAKPEARVSLVHRFVDLDRTAADVLLGRGYRNIRQLVRMETDIQSMETHLKPENGFPVSDLEGVRLVALEDGWREGALRALYEAFRDHWGALPETYEQYRERIQHMFERPEVTPALSLVALAGDEVAAAAICSSGTAEDPRMGWVNLLGVRRDWRKRGIGEAMLRRIFAGFQAVGLTRAGLNVDAESLTGATRLYEKVGMRVTRRYLTYELELRPGEELSLQQIAAKP